MDGPANGTFFHFPSHRRPPAAVRLRAELHGGPGESVMGRGRRISRARRRQISREARDIYSGARTLGLAVDQIQEQLLRAFPGELAVGEARMYAMGWTVPIVREG